MGPTERAEVPLPLQVMRTVIQESSAPTITEVRIHTWCDAFGMWHARVMDVGTTKAQRERARRAIVREIRQRQGDQRVSIQLVMGETRNDGTREWTER